MARWKMVAVALVGIGGTAGLSAAAETDGSFRALLAGAGAAHEHGWSSIPDIERAAPLTHGLERVLTVFGLAVAGSIVVGRVRDGGRRPDLKPEAAPSPGYGASQRSAA